MNKYGQRDVVWAELTHTDEAALNADAMSVLPGSARTERRKERPLLIISRPSSRGDFNTLAFTTQPPAVHRERDFLVDSKGGPRSFGPNEGMTTTCFLKIAVSYLVERLDQSARKKETQFTPKLFEHIIKEHIFHSLGYNLADKRSTSSSQPTPNQTSV